MKKGEYLIFSVLLMALTCGLTASATRSRCPPIKVRKDTIIRTKESIQNGARMLYRTEIDSSRECYDICCRRKSCNVGIVHYKKERDESTGEITTSKSCFIFACGSPNRCIFMNHSGYAVIEMKRNKEKPKKAKISGGKHNEEQPIVKEDCPPGSPVAMCADDPCKRATCPADKTARCVANFCGGCHAFFYDKQANRVQCKANIHKNDATTPKPEDNEATSETEQPSSEESSTNVSEEEVEIRPEDTGGKPTEDPNSPDDNNVEDPHAVKQWRTWLDSGDDYVHDQLMNVTEAPVQITTLAEDQITTLADNKNNGGQNLSGMDKSRKPIKIIENKQGSHVTVTLAVALGVCLFILIAVILKLKCTGPRKKKKFAVDDGDYLINGMYL